MAKQPRDWTRTGTIQGYAEYLCKSSNAICVLVIRADDAVLAVDPMCAPRDALELVKLYAPSLTESVEQGRQEKKKSARLELGPAVE